MAIQYFWRHPLAEQVREEGRQQGLAEAKARHKTEVMAEMIVRVLELRGVPVTDDVRARARACTDTVQLDVWGRRAFHAADAAELFAET
ncbi:hypothetical protein [Streptomyces sp. NPDC004376]